MKATRATRGASLSDDEDPGERPRVDENIARLALPATDPVFGKTGPLLEHWQVPR